MFNYFAFCFLSFYHEIDPCLFFHRIAEGFAFLVCTKWYNPAIHRHSHIRESYSSSMNIRYLDWNRGLVISSDEDQQQSGICDLQDVGGHVMKIPFIIFQILLFIYLEVIQELEYTSGWFWTIFLSCLHYKHFCNCRQDHLVLGIFQYQLFFLLFFCCKELGFYSLYIDWWRKLLSY